MAQPDLDFFRRRGLALKVETTEGTDPSGTSGADSFDLFDGRSGTEYDIQERPRDRTYFTGDSFTVGNKRIFIEGSIELQWPTVPGHISNGLAPAELALRIAGLQRALSTNKTEYIPVSEGIPSAHAYFYHAGDYFRAAGCRANLSQIRMAIGERFTAQVRIQGDQAEIGEAAVPTDFDYSAFTIPDVATHANTRMRIGTAGGTQYNLWGKSLVVDLNNALGTVEYTEKKITRISDRRPTFTLLAAKWDLDDFNPWAVRDAGTEITADFRILNATSGLYSMLKVRGQIEQIETVEIDGDYGYQITGRCIGSSSESAQFGIEFGDSTP